MSREIKITDLLDVIHYTIIKESGENITVLNELKSIENKINLGQLKNLSVNETSFWKSIIKNTNESQQT